MNINYSFKGVLGIEILLRLSGDNHVLIITKFDSFINSFFTKTSRILHFNGINNFLCSEKFNLYY